MMILFITIIDSKKYLLTFSIIIKKIKF